MSALALSPLRSRFCPFRQVPGPRPYICQLQTRVGSPGPRPYIYASSKCHWEAPLARSGQPRTSTICVYIYIYQINCQKLYVKNIVKFMSDRTSKCMSNIKMSKHMSDRMPELMSDRMSFFVRYNVKKWPDRMSKLMSNKMSKLMSDRMSDMPE